MATLAKTEAEQLRHCVVVMSVLEVIAYPVQLLMKYPEVVLTSVHVEEK